LVQLEAVGRFPEAFSTLNSQMAVGVIRYQIKFIF
jgi:hypothetical protein